MSATKALILVDLQNDFLPGGALEVPNGEDVISPANHLQRQFELVVATQDWHPRDHISFADNHPGRKPGDVIEVHGIEQILWPVHCVQQTTGARLVADLETDGIARVFRKGTDPEIDDYSGFYDNEHRHSTGLGEYLQEHGVGDVYLLGLATDVCVKHTALDARRLGFNTYVIADACRGVDLQPGDVDRALEEMRCAGAEVVQSSDVMQE